MVYVSFHTNLDLTISLSVIKEIGLWAINATFINISAILWRSVLYVEETKVSEENHWSFVRYW